MLAPLDWGLNSDNGLIKTHSGLATFRSVLLQSRWFPILLLAKMQFKYREEMESVAGTEPSFHFTHKETLTHVSCWPICVGSGSQPLLMCVCTYVCWPLPSCLLPLCNWGKQAHSDSHIHTHKASPHQSSPTQCCWPAVCSVQSDCWVQENGYGGLALAW